MVMSPPLGALHAVRLTHGAHGDDVLYRFSKRTRLRLVPDATLLGRRLQLYTNYPHMQDGGGDETGTFERSRYYALEWRRVTESEAATGEQLGTSLLLGDDHVCAELVLLRPGSYHYYFTCDTDQQPAGSGWVVVEPSLSFGGRELALDAVSCVTCVTRCLGALSRWERALRPCVEARYNLVHLTPVQQLGASGSAYCIQDQLAPDKGLGISSWSDLEVVLSRVRAQGVGAVCDVVLNHTANETPWLAHHPEASYNCSVCPHLRPAALLDHTIWRVSMDMAAGAVAGVPRGEVTEQTVRAAGEEVCRRARALQLHQCYQCDVDALHAAFLQLAKDRLPPPEGAECGAETRRLQLVPDGARRRLRATVDMELALRLYNRRHQHARDEDARLTLCANNFRRALETLNALAAAEMEAHLAAAATNLCAGARYERLQADGPRLGAPTPVAPLYPRYFTWPPHADAMDAADVERVVYGGEGATVRAHNGWVMDADPLEDFAAAAADGRVYVRRELLAWGDSVKLRYGTQPSDSPFLWQHMKRYVEMTAQLFVGVRLDNCHSTPLHVAEYMLDAARHVNPDLYVVAELFTNSPRVDNIYVNRLAITALVRECQSAWDAHEQGRLVHRFGGRAVGALRRPEGAEAAQCLPRALLMDQTHDNPSGLTQRSVHDVLPTAALAAAAVCATGSTRGVDELVPHAVSVVEERRLYAEWGDGPHDVGARSALLPARRLLNELHAHLAHHQYSEAFVDQMSADVVAVTRHHPHTRHSIIVIAATAFPQHAPPPAGYSVPPLRLEGELVEVMLEACLVWEGTGPEPAPHTHVPHRDIIDGYRGYECRIARAVPIADARWVDRVDLTDGLTTVQWRDGRLPAGAVMALKVRPLAAVRDALQRVHALLERPPHEDPVRAPLDALALTDYHALLYRCEAEERECSDGGGVYQVPGHGPLVYAGLQGVESLLAEVRRADDMGHALCANLRAGDWLQQYTWRRLRGPRLQPVADAYRAALDLLLPLPRFLQPVYYDAIVQRLYAAVTGAALRRVRSPPAGGGGPLARALALCSVQLVGSVPSGALPLPPPLPAYNGSLAAGLPHFSTGYMRCWGRDTFVALPGLLVLTGRWEDARAHILAYGAALRHGLIPNLLDGGRRARYNCRDAVWWWLHAAQHYARHAPDGAALLRAPVPRLYPTDDAEPGEDAAALPVQPLHDVVQEALTAHFEGRTYRERGAGERLDAHMSDAGFTVTIGVCPDTGFVFGGSDHNSGTWMDKMGSSERAGIRGRPATPRDGSAIELVALSHAALLWLHAEHAAGRTPHAGVTRPHADTGARTAWTWLQWADRIKDNFERHFWIPPAPSAADARPDLVHRRGIYKDTHGATRAYGDYQLRCNMVLAMAASPSLFVPQHAWSALQVAEQQLLGEAGLRTLDPADWTYRARYDPADDSADPLTAHGYNYHQGPQWVWPIGAYVRATLHYARLTNNAAHALPHCLRAIAPLAAHLRADPWRSLPELAHGDGARCEPSCRAQAWSCGAVLEALDALRAA